ncbi:MAG: hypothetical protein H6740_28870 [Alphaproteobacteria bacterium]|nr:hypothetical protein [Alphaproteobacteria bacterium]
MDSDSAATDTGTPRCAEVSGSGCARLGGEGPSLCDSELPSSDGEGQELTGQVEGGAWGCAPLSASAPGLWLLALLFLWRRRRALLPLLLLGLVSEARAQGVNANHVEVLDGGDFPVLLEARLGGAWSAAAAVSAHYA